MDELLLVDGTYLSRRSWALFPDMCTSYNRPTGAIWGATRAIRDLRDHFKPTLMAVIFDTPNTLTFRHELYPAYKANRPRSPMHLIEAIDTTCDILDGMGICSFMKAGVEADDIIASISAMATLEEVRTRVATTDKDMAQLVNSRVSLVHPKTKVEFDETGVLAHYGVAPHRMVELQTLTGDAVDNVPGVRGIGPKKAAMLINHYGSLALLLAHASKIKGKTGEWIRAIPPGQIALTRELVKLRTDVDVGITSCNDMKMLPQNTTALIGLFRDLEFKKWLVELLNEGGYDGGE